MAKYEATVAEPLRRGDAQRHYAAAAIALADNRPTDAVAAYRTRFEEGDFAYFGSCGLYQLGRVYDALGEVDSAVAVWERTLQTSHSGNIFADAWSLAATYRRLGEIYEERWDAGKAVQYYNEFVERWRDANDELQGMVEDVKGRIARLVSERR